MGDIDSITKEALKRAAQMHNYMPKQSNRKTPERKQTQFTPPPIAEPRVKNQPVKSEDDKAETIEYKPEKKQENLVDMLLGNKEQSLILLLLALLMGENSDPSIILALLYLLL